MNVWLGALVVVLLGIAGCFDERGGGAGEVDAGASEPEPGDGSPDSPSDAEASVALEPGCTATGTLGGHRVWLHFTRPPAPCRPNTAGDAGIDTHILTELIRLIDSVPPGGRIDGNIFNITVNAVGAALLRAQEERGVEVWLSTDKRVGQSSDSVKSKYLDKLDHRVYCGTGSTGSCIGATSNSIAHTKLFVFSTASAPDGTIHEGVSWFGSANQTQASGMKSFNNTATVYGDMVLYGEFRTYLGDLYHQRRRTDYYDAGAGRGYMMAAAAKAYASPETSSDLVVNRLNDVTPDSDCRVRVMQASVRDSRMAVVNHLIKMKNGGCKVWVAANTVEPNALAALRGAGIKVRKHRVHDKVFLIRGRYGGKLRYRAYTGSHNLSISANRKYDEIFVKLAPEKADSHPVYDAYYTHFNDAYNNGTPL